MSDKKTTIRPAYLLEKDWHWVDYDDCSGYLENGKGEKFYSYDFATQEYRDLNNKWTFMYNYPSVTTWDEFKSRRENEIAELGLSKYNKLAFFVAILEQDLGLQYDDRIFKGGYFTKWSAYRKLDDAHKALSDLYDSRESQDGFDIIIVERLSEFYRADTICDLLTNNQKGNPC